MLEWVTIAVGFLGILVGNFLTRSMEYRKWLRVERHKACTSLLSASQTALNAAAYRQSVAGALKEGLKDPFQQFANLIYSPGAGWLVRFMAKRAAKGIVQGMNPSAAASEVAEGVSGVIASLQARVEQPTVDFISERLGAGPSGKLTQVKDVAHQLSQAVEAVELICPDEVAAAGRRLFDASLVLVQCDPGSGEWEAALSSYESSRRIFVLTSRQDLVSRRKWRGRGSRNSSESAS